MKCNELDVTRALHSNHNIYIYIYIYIYILYNIYNVYNIIYIVCIHIYIIHIYIYIYIFLYHPHKTNRPNVLGVLPREAVDLPGSGAIAPPENIQALLS